MQHHAVYVFPAVLAYCVMFSNGLSSQPKTTRHLSPGSACPGDTCTTSECRTTAKLLLDSLNQQIDPCENFYDFACGGWIKTHPIPGNEPLISQFWNVSETTKVKVQQLFQNTNRPTTFKSERTMQQMYQQCQDQDQIEKTGGTPLIYLLDEQIGGWPIITQNWNPKNFDLFKVLTTLRIYSDEPLFSIAVSKDQEAPTRNVIWLSEPTLFTTGDVLQNGDGKLYMDSYAWYIRNVTAMLISDSGRRIQDTARIDRELKEVVDLERYLVLSEQTALDSNDLALTKNKTTLGTIRQNIFRSSSIAQNLTSYLKSVFALAGLGDKISNNTKIVLKSPRYFERLDSKLMELERQGDVGKRRMANYIGWKLITSYDGYLSKKYRTANAEYSRRVYGQSAIKVTPTNERCASILVALMPLAVGATYVNRTVPADLKEKADMMANDIKAGFGELLEEAAWMDRTTYQKALHKLASMRQIVAYPDLLIRNLGAIDEQYKNMRLENTFFKTYHEACKANNLINLNLLEQINNRGDPLYDSPDVTDINASYDPFSNIISVLAGILQRPFFNSQSPQYLNYGAIGSIFGHEITHGFDNQELTNDANSREKFESLEFYDCSNDRKGSLFDDVGNMRSWWTESTRAKYDQRGQGMVAQYNNFSLPVGNVSGLLTLGENIADNGGIKAAYQGYQRFRKRQSCVEPNLPGLEKFSFDQLFFISAGQVWCSNVRPEAQQLLLLADPHSPARFRVIGEMSNLPEFSTAFKCPAGSKMNLSKKQMVCHRLDRNFSNGHKSQMPVGKPGAWNTYRFSKGMFTFAAFLTSTSLYFTIVVVNGLPFNGVASTEVWRGSICTTNGCKATAKGILDSLNQNVDPCADFYEFVCGGWKRANQIPDDEPLNSQLWRVGENTKLKVQRVLQATKAPTFNSEATVKEIFLQCQDKDGQIEKAVGKPLLQLLDNQIGGWPVITPNWNPRNFDLTKTLVTLRAYLDEPLFITLVRKDQETPTKNVILLGEPNLFTNGDVLQNEDAELYMDSYSWYLRNVTSMLIADSDRRALLRNTTGINSDLTEIIDLERYLALAGQTTLDKLNTSLTKDKTTLRAVRQNIFRSSSIARNLTSYLKSVFAVAGLGNEISDNTNIVLKSPEFFKKLDSKLMEIERQGDQGKRYLANYIGWKLIYTYASGLSEKYRNAEDEYTRRILGQDEAKDISADEGCAETLIKFMPLAVSAMYVSQVVSKDLKEKTKVMAGDIRAGLGEILANATWMDATTNRAAVKKLAAMVQIVGYSDLLSGNLSVIDELYKNITLQNTLFNTSHEASKAKNIMNLRRLKQTNVRADPLISSPDVTEPNARYDPASNSITVQAGILQLPFYDSQSPQYLNYGAIGSVIGHEITHGFDNQGSLYDDQGNMRSWWSESTRKAYDLRGQGMVLQYNNFSLPFGRVNGKLTLGENIADNGGLKAAYLGYRRFRERQSCVEPALFGLDRFSFEQLFFIAAGQNWCSNQRPEIEKLSLLMDPHSPHRFRVIGEMSNLPAFSTAFKCSIGSKMNPLKKQTVW